MEQTSIVANWIRTCLMWAGVSKSGGLGTPASCCH